MLHTLRLVELVYIALELVKRQLVEPKQPTKLKTLHDRKIQEDSLDSILSPSHSVKIQIMGGKGVKTKHFWMLSTKF